ncbi:hypothetical protein L1047_06580 [Synechococcus sp. Nb3U1]|uniref:hypothetical protein n=1 Tax=Synechococcus sp. Nb3U1 TaxID=1914529 RepID=UPI001F1F5EC3|nr:hypothetical protein [Synechococcus sp. Nb3U1]MCF2970861.1 hypothetical protein [Synechococcus sp. Nb3U1]
MDVDEKSREQVVKERQHSEHLEETMRTRKQAELEHGVQHREVIEQARESLAKHRQQESHIQETMLERTEERLEQSSQEG